MIAIIDYGTGNVLSVEKALRHIGCECQLIGNGAELLRADAAVLPGVGAFGEAMRGLRDRELCEPIHEFIDQGRPFLGICLGLQVLFDSSQESPGEEGLGILPGKILRLCGGPGLKIPHMGWNSLKICKPGWLLDGLGEEPYMYFVHSYFLQAEGDFVCATAEYGDTIHAAVQQGNLAACQFHPEKSGAAGLKILKNFARRLRKQD